ncbi:IclR family transcriptional regulator [Luteococcus peritonei]|uniref:IclR family transcriptional regulator n=1 Tax=Luteococcus peritonei TaxID=88874 RepID=A0ABW4RSQ2_9ACTN
MATSSVPALARAMRIVDLLAGEGQPGLGVTEIANRTGIAKSTTALLCTALEEEGMLRRHGNHYRLGRRFLGLAGDYLATVDQLGDFYDEVRRQPLMSTQAARLALLDGTDVIYLARYEVGHTRRLSGAIGDRFPASITATGKAMLSTLPPGAVEDRYRGKLFPRFTERSIQSLPELEQDLALVRERGYALDDEETNLGQVCVALPVVNVPGEVAQLSVSTTVSKELFTQTPVEVFVAELRQVVEIFENPLADRSF